MSERQDDHPAPDDGAGAPLSEEPLRRTDGQRWDAAVASWSDPAAGTDANPPESAPADVEHAGSTAASQLDLAATGTPEGQPEWTVPTDDAEPTVSGDAPVDEADVTRQIWLRDLTPEAPSPDPAATPAWSDIPAWDPAAAWPQPAPGAAPSWEQTPSWGPPSSAPAWGPPDGETPAWEQQPRPAAHQHAPQEPAPYEQAPYSPAQYQQGQYEQGQYEQAPYQQAPYEPAPYEQSQSRQAAYEPAAYPQAGGQPAWEQPAPWQGAPPVPPTPAQQPWQSGQPARGAGQQGGSQHGAGQHGTGQHGAGQQGGNGSSPTPQRPTPPPSLTSQTLLRTHGDTPTRGWRKFVHKATAGSYNPGLSPAEIEHRALVARVTTPVRGSNRIAVVSLKGGIGKTTTTSCLGLTLAHHRGDRVVAVDANPDAGTLAERLTNVIDVTVRDLLANIDSIRSFTDVSAFTSLAGRLQVLASDQDPALSEAFSEEQYRAVADILARYFNIILTDSGTGLLHSAMSGTLAIADSLVVVGAPSVDGASRASKTLDWLIAHGHEELVSRSVAVISSVRPNTGDVDMDLLRQHFGARCRAVIEIPYDSHLVTGGLIDLARVGAPAQRAFLELAAAVADGFALPPIQRAAARV